MPTMHLNDNFTSETELKQKLDFIYEQSSKEKNFHGIMEVAFNDITITTAIHNIKANKGAQTEGVDKLKMDTYLQMDRNELLNLIRESAYNYMPKPARREYIKKSNGKMRPLGIPTIKDRIIQECIRIVIDPIVEAKFYPHSYGFRPYRTTKHAIRDILNNLNNRSKEKAIYALEGDIKGYFDNINHKILIRKLWNIGIHDKRILMIIRQMLKAGYVEKELFYDSELGTPQGGIISPLLANVYLNDFDWFVGRMYYEPRYTQKDIKKKRELLRAHGTKPKYLIRYADDWVILTTQECEANRLRKTLKKYFKHKLKLELSEEKTVISNITKSPMKFLGFNIIVEKPRPTPKNPNPTEIVGKPIPNQDKVHKQYQKIKDEIKKIRYLKDDKARAVHIENINAKILGIAEYWKTSICSSTFQYFDESIYWCAYRVFCKLYGTEDTFNNNIVQLKELANRPQRHEGYESLTLAVKVESKYIGLTKMFLTHSQWVRYPFNQKITPYTSEGRDLYTRIKEKSLPKDRPPLYDNMTLLHAMNKPSNRYNFEYYMNREYAYNRDKGKCRCCGKEITGTDRHCHHVNPNLPLTKVNKVPNLAWMHFNCHWYIHGKEMPSSLDTKIIKKVNKFKQELQSSNND